MKEDVREANLTAQSVVYDLLMELFYNIGIGVTIDYDDGQSSQLLINITPDGVKEACKYGPGPFEHMKDLDIYE